MGQHIRYPGLQAGNISGDIVETQDLAGVGFGSNNASTQGVLASSNAMAVRGSAFYVQSLGGGQNFAVFESNGINQIAGGPHYLVGSGSPAGVVSAPVGSLYLRTDGGANTTIYVKESGTGTSGWVAK